MRRKIGGRIEVNFSEDGWPHWTTIRIDGEQVLSLDHEDARDLAHALNRIVAKLNEADALDVERQKKHMT